MPHVASLGWCGRRARCRRAIRIVGGGPGPGDERRRGSGGVRRPGQCDKLQEEVDDAAQELAALDDWQRPAQSSPSQEIRIIVPFHAHRAQAMGFMVTPLSRDDGAVPPADPPPAFEVLHRLVDELARATVVSTEELDVPEWRLRRAAAGVAYAACEVRALTDDEDLGKSSKSRRRSSIDLEARPRARSAGSRV